MARWMCRHLDVDCSSKKFKSNLKFFGSFQIKVWLDQFYHRSTRQVLFQFARLARRGMDVMPSREKERPRRGKELKSNVGQAWSKSSSLSDTPGFIVAPDFSQLFAEVLAYAEKPHTRWCCHMQEQVAARGNREWEGIKGKERGNRNGRAEEIREKNESARLDTGVRSAERRIKNRENRSKLLHNIRGSIVLFSKTEPGYGHYLAPMFTVPIFLMFP